MDINEKLDKHTDLIKRHAQVALRKIMKPAKYSLDDLIQEGVLAFLYAEREFVEGRGASFQTFLTTCLRNHLTNLVKQTYRSKEMDDPSSWNNLRGSKFSGEINSKKERNVVPDTSEIVQVFFIIESFSDEELEYVDAMLSLVHKSRGGRRKATRKNLGISYERETELRNSIRDKIRK